MSNEVLIALITVGLGGLITLAVTFVNSKAAKATVKVNENTAEVEAMSKAMGGMKILTEEQRAELDRAYARIVDLEAENRKLKRARRAAK